ncbi:VOC family protein [Streptomyces sp. JJ38]|uniref:VOC family protein n=1 Tax=Streptomyces sp. JJ38 TaxID=2738128 RepID=UPI0027E21724|nr:VOC family protein [Streptomyces sp. JJ38]
MAEAPREAAGEPPGEGAGEGPPEGTPCWADVMVSDLAAAKRFYGELFGWTFDEPAPAAQGHYTPARSGGRMVAGLMRKTDGRMPTVWTVYLAVSDARAAAGRVSAAGGQVIGAPRPVGSGPAGIMGTAADPGGAVFGLWEARSHTGFGRWGEPGSYIWTEVHTRSPAEVDVFYPEVFGYRPLSAAAVRDPDAQGEEPAILVWAPRGRPADEEHAVVARCLMEEGTPPELPAHFLVYFAVDGCEAAVETVRRLGGRVRRAPELGPYGRWAVCTDNQGADFAVLDPGEEQARESPEEPARAASEAPAARPEPE